MSAGATRLFVEVLDRCVPDARVAFRRDGTLLTAGQGDGPPDVVVRVHDERMFQRALTLGNLGLGEAYMDGDFELEQGTLAGFLALLLRNRLDERLRRHPRLAARVLAMRLRNALRGARRNVRRHYDLGEDLFESFLDRTMTYSCGYAVACGDSLEALQHQKLDRICRKLRLSPGLRLLDIGCGFGGLLIHAAREHGVSGVGVSNSRSHSARARAEIARAGLGERLAIVDGDFGEVAGSFQRVVSVGMLEHVAPRDHGRYFRTIAARLAPGGLGLVHAIGCNAPRNVHDPFTQTYIFPGSHQPRLSQIAARLEANRLAVLDVENIVRHYGCTVARWLERFRENAGRLDPVKYDGRFRRMWEYYLSCGIAAAAVSDSAVYQVLFTNDCTLELPLARV
ncbi:MAG TPA: class I SAM-dependent methyltransferase [Vicinamibacterales bacterium]|nr:class I SAM-dependent methyltransferase [Vicinamibacterales bacterium]